MSLSKYTGLSISGFTFGCCVSNGHSLGGKPRVGLLPKERRLDGPDIYPLRDAGKIDGAD